MFADADLDAAIDGVIGGIFEGSGQSCVAGSRLYVQRGIAESFIARLAERAGRLRVDLPDAERAQMGPIASFDHRGKIEGMVDAARREGAEVVLGGQRPDQAQLRDGAFYLPTILSGLARDATVVREEISGPCCARWPSRTRTT